MTEHQLTKAIRLHDAKINAMEVNNVARDVFKGVIEHKEFLERMFKEL